MTFFQRDPFSGGPSFSILPHDGIGSMAFAFDILLGSQDIYQTVLSMDQLSRNVVSYYSSSSATRPTSTSDVTLDGASFWVNVTAPGSLVAVCFGGLMTRRRRRWPNEDALGSSNAESVSLRRRLGWYS